MIDCSVVKDLGDERMNKTASVGNWENQLSVRNSIFMTTELPLTEANNLADRIFS